MVLLPDFSRSRCEGRQERNNEILRHRNTGLQYLVILVIHFPGDIEILGWYQAGSVLPHEEKGLLQPWLATVLVVGSQ